MAGKTLSLRKLYNWFEKNQRDLPFRKKGDFYSVWVSEVMLQQTRVAAMLPRYQEFMKSFPRLKDLAAAREEQVLEAWRGLGYYSRARNLQKGAVQVMENHGGQFPRDHSQVLKLSGVGEYTAAAVLSISYGLPHAVLDGNVKRVLSRLLHLSGEAASPVNLKAKADQLMESQGKKLPGLHNQAIMELGALICLPGTPNCSACPLKTYCAVYATGGPELAATLPAKKKEAKKDVLYQVYIITDAKRENLWIVREKNSRFFRNLWFFPSSQLEIAPGGGADRGSFLRDSPLNRGTPGLKQVLNHGKLKEARTCAKNFKHSITHHRITGQVELVQLNVRGDALSKQLNALSGGDSEWRRIPVSKLESLVVSSVAPKILKILRADTEENFLAL